MAGTRTDSEGYYRLATVMPLKSSFSYRVSVKAAEYGPTQHTLTERMNPGDVITIPDMRLVNADAFVSGIVVDENDHPVAYKSVHIGSDSGGDYIRRSTSTDEQGRFKFNRIAEGPLSLQVCSATDPDCALVYAHSGDHVKIRLGERMKHYISPSSLVGKPLPDLRDLEIGYDYNRSRGKRILVCFVDYKQRPSQYAIGLLNKRQIEIGRSNIKVVCIQAAPTDEGDLRAWKKENKISIPIYCLPGQSGRDDKGNLPLLKSPSDIMDNLKQHWGVRSFPWTIFADENQCIEATGLNIPRILNILYEEKPRSPLGNNPWQRR